MQVPKIVAPAVKFVRWVKVVIQVLVCKLVQNNVTVRMMTSMASLMRENPVAH